MPVAYNFPGLLAECPDRSASSNSGSTNGKHSRWWSLAAVGESVYQAGVWYPGNEAGRIHCGGVRENCAAWGNARSTPSVQGYSLRCCVNRVRLNLSTAIAFTSDASVSWRNHFAVASSDISACQLPPSRCCRSNAAWAAYAIRNPLA